MIHDKVCESQKLNNVSFEAGELWFRLLTVVDDNGNYYRDALRIYANLVQEKKGATQASTERAVKDLERVGLVATYEADGRRYLHLTDFEKHQKLRKDLAADVTAPIHPSDLGPAYTKDGDRRDACIRPGTVAEHPVTSRPEAERKGNVKSLEVEGEVKEEVEDKADDEQVFQSEPEEKDAGDWPEFVRFFRSKAGGTKDFARFPQNQETYHAKCRQYGSEAVDSVVEDWVELKGGKSQTKKNSFACKNFLAEVDGLIEDRNENADKSVGPDVLRPRVQY